MEKNILNGYIGFKGEEGLSAYDIAVANGFEGTEKDWLANLGTSSIFDQYKKVVTTSAETSKIEAPEEYTNTAFIEIFESGLRLNKNQYSIITVTEGENEKYEITFNPAIETGKILEIVTTQMTTNSLPIVDTIDENSTNDTSPGTKAVYEKIKDVTDNITTLQTIIDTIYPVGCIYIATNNLSPEVLFGGKWSKIKDKFLLACGDEYENGTTGGEATHKLTPSELATHSHGNKTLKGELILRDAKIDDHDTVLSTSGIIDNSLKNWSGSHAALQTIEMSNYKKNVVNFDASHEHLSVGENQPHNNMPPYIAVCMWERIG